MLKCVYLLKSCQMCVVAVLLGLTGVSCIPALVTSNPTPDFQTIEVTREVTQEVTRIVEAIVTPIYTYTPSLTPTITLTPEPPIVTILVHSACNYGPGGAYLYKYGLNETSWMEVIGRNLDGTWLYVQGVHGWNPCWVKADLVHFNTGGDVSNYNIPIVYSELPYSALYRPPDGVQAFRSGNEVTIYWNAVWMTEDDYEGYLIEAWLCQNGQQVFKPIGYVPPLSQNTGTLGIKVIDEPGCLVPSSARIYTAEKYGYTGYIMIPWSPFQSTPTPTL